MHDHWHQPHEPRHGRLNRLLRLAVDVRPGETRAMLWGALYYFALMASYYPLRAIRDEIGARDGAEGLSELFTATFIAMMVAVPVFSWLVSRVRRQTLLPWVYEFFALNILGFYALFLLLGERLEQMRFLNHDGLWWLGAAYFVWVSVYNLFVVSVFWGYMADLFRAEQGKRLFGFIAFGASVGAIVGAFIPSFLAEAIGSLQLMLISAALLQIAVLCLWGLGRVARDERAAIDLDAAAAKKTQADSEQEVGGSWWEAFSAVARSPYLIGIASYVLLYTATSTLLYFIQAEVVDAAFKDRDTRTAVFGRIDLATNVLSMVVQAFIAGRLMARLGVGLTLVILPIVSLIGFIVLVAVPQMSGPNAMWFGLAPILVAFIPFQVIRRASNYALAKPSREVLFTVVSRSEKYKAKVFIDTAIYRAGDAATAWALEPLRAIAGVVALTGIGIPLTIGWIVLALVLGRAQHRRQQQAPVPAQQAVAT